ncbi:hypothetical protein ABZ695_30820 [Streptomyces sp. NPDC006976]|uniref:hypothetical protein n=1 Tax=Streptomyces sp. NPDC006976 TaxID=3154311 RepID=UPI0033EE438D
MRELWGIYRVHFWLALALCGADLLCLASTWLPGAYAVPKWLVMGLFIAIFPVFFVAIVLSFTSGAESQLMGPSNAGQFIRYVLLLPPALKLTYGFVICLAVLGFATGGDTAEDVQADASGYYYIHRDRTGHPERDARVELTESEYYEASKSQLRIFSAGPAVFHAFSSFLVLASASAAAGRARSAPGRSYDPAELPKWS